MKDSPKSYISVKEQPVNTKKSPPVSFRSIRELRTKIWNYMELDVVEEYLKPYIVDEQRALRLIVWNAHSKFREREICV